MSEQAIIGDKYSWNKNKKFLAYFVSSALLITFLLFVALPAYTNQQIQKHETERLENEKEEKEQQELNVLGEKEEDLEEEGEETTSTTTPSISTTTSSSTSTPTPPPTSTITPPPTSTITPPPTTTITPPPTTIPEKTYDCTDEEMAGLIEERKDTMLAIANLTNIKLLEIYECKQEISGSLSSCITVCENKVVRQEIIDACIASCKSKWVVSSCDSFYNNPTHTYNIQLNSLNSDLIGINSALDLCYLERK